MRLWQKIRALFRRRSRFGVGVKLRQAGLRHGRAIRPEQTVCHFVTVAFARPDVDDATYRLLGDRQTWRQLLEEDRGAADCDDERIAFDDFLLAMLDDDSIVTICAPHQCPPLPLGTMPYSTIGYNELVLDLAERCDQVLSFAACSLNAMPQRLAWPLVHHLARLAARETGGLILDQLSERWWSLERWASLDPYPGREAISNWVVIHDVVDDSGPAQMHTHGMLHFGLPDLELVDVPRFHRAGAAKLINAACLKLISLVLSEGCEVRVGDELTITGDDVRQALHPADALTDEAGDESDMAAGSACICLVRGDAEAALVENRLLRILPAARYGQGSEGLAACLLDLFPEEQQVGDVADEAAMQAAHRRALATLPAERERFRRGLRPGERLAVKVCFPYGEHNANEYMWVEVQYWNGEGPQATIEGVLLNQPLHRPDLKLGQRLRVAQSAVFDWLRITARGRQEGNFTAAALEM
jgi:uncharacterized protein YegJ (DUF2314 family)